MSKRDKIYSEFFEYEIGELPIDNHEEISKLFGARIIGAMDTNLKEAFYQIDRLDGVAKLTDAQKSAVKEVLKNNSKGFLYSMLVKMRSFSYPIEVNFLNPNIEEEEKLFGLDDDFHFYYFDWIEEFSDYIDEA